MKLFKRVKKGFTLVELVVVIAVIAILAAVSVGAYFGVTESAKASKVEQESKGLVNSITLVGSTGSENHHIDKNGLHIYDIEVFAEDLKELTGIHYDVYTDDVSSIYGPTLVLNEAAVSGAPGAFRTYTSFSYYTNEATGIRGNYDFTTATYTKENASFDVVSALMSQKEVNDFIAKLPDGAENPTIVRIGANIVFDDHLLIHNKNIILDMAGHTFGLRYKNGITHWDGPTQTTTTNDGILIHLENNAKVVITGKGTFQLSNDIYEDGSNCDHTYVGDTCSKCGDRNYGTTVVGVYTNSELTIKNGNFITKPLAGCAVLYVRNQAKINVEGGVFNAALPYINDRYYTLNSKITDNDLVINQYEFTGGRVYHNNPNEWTHNPYYENNPVGQERKWDYVPEGYDVVSGSDNYGTYYDVVKL